MLTVHIQFANNGEKFTLLTKKFASEVTNLINTKQQKKFTLLQKKITLMKKKLTFLKKKSLQKVYIIYQKLTEKFTNCKPV